MRFALLGESLFASLPLQILRLTNHITPRKPRRCPGNPGRCLNPRYTVILARFLAFESMLSVQSAKIPGIAWLTEFSLWGKSTYIIYMATTRAQRGGNQQSGDRECFGEVCTLR
jgi:hypothetical protein